MGKSDYKFNLLQEAHRQQRSFSTVDPRYKEYAKDLVERGYITHLNPSQFPRIRLSVWGDAWEPTQKGYRLFKRWLRLKNASAQ